ncbi:MAG: hypothetical protein IJB31_03465 [Akkermansia sp.]|nr:hypothetical protein [Akkermansia sp.]
MAARRRDRFHARRGIWAKGSKVRRILTWVSIIICAVVILLVVAYYQLLAHLQSPEFCRELSRHAKAALQAEDVTLRDALQIDGDRITLGEATATNTRIINALSARGISVEINRSALWNRTLSMRKLAVEESELHLAFGQAQARKKAKSAAQKQQNAKPAERQAATKAPAPTPEPAREQMSGIPRQFSLDFFECKDSDVHIQLGESKYSLHGCTTTASPQTKLGHNTWQINVENGRLHTPFSCLQDTSIKNATLIASPREISLAESRMMLTPGELRVRGAYNIASKRWSGLLRANKANVARLLNPEWKKRLHGEVYGELELTGTQEGLSSGLGFISLQKGVLEGLPILSDLQFHNTFPYRSLPLEKAECRLSYPYNDPSHNILNAWIFDQINIRSANGLLIVRGHVIIGSDQSLGGTLSIGIPENRFNDIQLRALSGIFGQRDEQGYLWLNLNLSGTLDDPHEDLSVRLTTILGQALPQLAGDAAQGLHTILNNFFTQAEPQENGGSNSTSEKEEQTTPASTIEKAGNLINNTLQSLF